MRLEDWGNGGNDKPHSNASDSLLVVETARRLYAITEGEAEGLVDLWKSIKLNGTPIQNPDGTFNFNDISVALVHGTATQQAIPGFADIETEYGGGAEVKASTPQFITVNNLAASSLRVKIGFQSLQRIDQSSGKPVGAAVQIAMDLQSAGGGYVTQILHEEGKISGTSTGPTSLAYSIPLSGDGPWTLRIRRLTADTTDQYLQDKTFLAGWTEIEDVKLRRPHTALLAIAYNAREFSSLPKVTLVYRGVKVPVPSNYDPATRTYTGAWNGLFKEAKAYTNNPAWHLYNLAIHSRYGAGRYLSSMGLDIWTLYEIAQMSDELVPDGMGGWEPRFRFNMYYTTPEEAFKVLAHLISVARAQLYYGGSPERPATSLTAIQDVDGPVRALYSPSNVIGGRFSYEGTPRKSRFTRIVVYWNDPAQGYRLVPVLVQADPQYVARYGVQSAPDTVALGATSKGQAIREGKRILLSNLMELEAVKFSVGLEGVASFPGELAQVQDPVRDRKRLAGRIHAATTGGITLDGPVTLEPGVSYTAWLQLPDGSIAERVITTPAGTVAAIAWSGPLPDVPQVEAQWQITPTATAPTRWRVLGIEENKTKDSVTYEIKAIANVPAKYALMDDPGTVVPFVTTTPTLAPVTGLTLTSRSSWVQGNGVHTIQAAWTTPAGATGVSAKIRGDKGAWQDMQVSGGGAAFDSPSPGYFEVQIRAIHPKGVSSAALAGILAGLTVIAPATCTLAAATAVPAAVAHERRQVSSERVSAPGVDGSGNPLYYTPVYLTQRQTYADTVNPASFILGFDVVFTTVADATDVSKHLVPSIRLDLTDIGTTVAYVPKASQTVYAAVRTVYASGEVSAWKVSAGVAVTAATVGIATSASVDTLNADDTLSRAKKSQLISDYNAEIQTRAQLQAGAGACVPPVSHATYTAAVDALATFLGGLSPSWMDVTQDTPLGAGGGATLRSKWSTIGSTRTALQNAIGQAQALKASNDAISTAAADATSKMGTATANALAQSPTLVAGLPVLPNASYPSGKMVLDSTTNRLYTSQGSTWKAATATVASTDITGQLLDAQVAGLAASKVTGQMTDAQIQAVAAAKVAGTLVDSQIASGISAAKISGALANASIPTTQLTGQVQAAQIQANSIGANQIAAHSIVANNLTLANLDNMIPNANSEQAAPSGGWPSGAYEAVGLVSGVFKDGSKCRRFVAAGTGAYESMGVTPLIPVVPGEQYYLSAWVLCSPSPSSAGKIWMSFWNAAGAEVGDIWTSPFTANDSAWVFTDVGFTVPAGAVGMGLALGCYAAQAGQAFFFDNLSLRRKNDANLIVDGSVIASKMAANSITAGNAAIADAAIASAKIQDAAITNAKIANLDAGKINAGYLAAARIQAGSLDASKITAGSVTSDRMAANSITGDRIAANSLDASKIVASSITAGQIAAGAIGAREVAANSIYTSQLTVTNLDNLIPNGNSMLPAPAGGWGSMIEGRHINTNGVQRDGQSANRLHIGMSENWGLSDPIPVSQGDQYVFGMYVLAGSGYDTGFQIYFFAQNAAGAEVSSGGTYSPDSSPFTDWNVWRKIEVVCTIPAGVAQITPCIIWGTSGMQYYCADMYMRKKVDSNVLVDGAVTAKKLAATAIETTDYNYNGGNILGTRIQVNYGGVPGILTSAAGLQIGPTIFSAYMQARIVQALDGTTAGGRVMYRGNCDPTSRGGAPNIGCLTVYRRRWDTTLKTGRLELVIQPSVAGSSDNLDGLREAQVDLYRQSAAGTTATLTLIDTWYPALKDRSYGNFGSDTDSANNTKRTFCATDAGISSGYPAAIITLHNAYGPSASGCFYSAAGNVDGSALVNNGNNWIGTSLTGGAGGGTGGGGGSGGGGCPAPWVGITLASGLVVLAGDLWDGAEVAGVNDITGEAALGIVRAPHRIWKDRAAVLLEDGRAPEFSLDHRLLTEEAGWIPVKALQPGQTLLGSTAGRVKAIAPAILGEVVTFGVDGCHTYISDGVMSHNLKPLT